jgi:hypothetical protein
LEEQWIDSLDNAATASLSQVASGSSTSTLIQGIVTGIFFNLLPFFFFREPKPPVFWENGSELEVYGSVVFSYVRNLDANEPESESSPLGSACRWEL